MSPYPVRLPAAPADAPKQIEGRKAARPKRAAAKPAPAMMTTARRLSFAPPAPVAPPSPAEPAKPQRAKAAKRKNDPKLVAAARELRDRWLERVNAGEYVLEDAGKYDVARALPAAPTNLQSLPHAA